MRERITEITDEAIFLNRAYDYLMKLNKLLEPYFTTGTGSSLDQQSRLYVTELSRIYAFSWTRLNMIERGEYAKGDVLSTQQINELLHVFDIKDNRMIGLILNKLNVSPSQRSSLNYRANVIAEKALGRRKSDKQLTKYQSILPYNKPDTV